MVLRNLGWLAWRGGPFADAEEPLRHAIEEARAVGDESVERWATHDLGIILTRTGADAEGLDLLHRSLELARAGKDLQLIARCYINIPATLTALDRLDEAIAMAAEGFEVARRTGDLTAQFWVGNNLADMYHGGGRLLEAIPIQELAVQAARHRGMHSSAGLPEYAHMLLHAGRFDEARAAWDQVVADEHETEPQNLARETILEAVFRWRSDPAAGIRHLREGLPHLREAAVNRGLHFVALHLARMGAREGDTDALREAGEISAAIVAEDSSAFAQDIGRWIAGLATDPYVPDAALKVGLAAENLEARGWRLQAAHAYSDAAFVAELAGQAPAAWSSRAAALYEAMSAVPALEMLRSSAG